MKQLTAAEFKAEVKRDPAWASKLTEPVEITSYCDMGGSKISHLSTLLHFTGRDGAGRCARFAACKNLQIAEGTFHGHLDFSQTNIEKIGGLVVTQPDVNGNAASFWGCPDLKIAEGNFAGYVGFNNSGVKQIGKLAFADEDAQRKKYMNLANFSGCDKLTLPKDWLEKPGIKMDDNLRERSINRINARKAMKQPTFEL